MRTREESWRRYALSCAAAFSNNETDVSRVLSRLERDGTRSPHLPSDD